MKKVFILTIPLVLSGCDSSIDCNDPTIMNKVKDAVISGFSLAEPGFAASFLSSPNTSIEVKGENSNNSDGIQQCNYSFKIQPPVASASEVYNTQPILVNVSKDNDNLVIDTHDNITKKVYDLIKNNNIEEKNDGIPTEYQNKLIEEKKVAEKEKLEKEKIEKENQDKIEKERKLSQEKYEKEAEEKRKSSISKIESLNRDTYKLTPVNDIVFFYSAKKLDNLTDDQYLKYFSPTYTNEQDIFKKDEMKEDELKRVKSAFNNMKSIDGISIMYPITRIGYSSKNYFGMNNGERYSYAMSNSDPSKNLLAGFDVSNNTIDLSKTSYSTFCKTENDSPESDIVIDSPGNVGLSVKNQNKLSSCIIELNNKENAREAYEQLSRSEAGYNSTKIAFIVDLYTDGVLENNGLRTYISNFELRLKDKNNQEKIYTAVK